MARGITRIKGFDTVMRNLNRELREIEGRTQKGVIEGAIIIRRKTETVPPVVPVDWGNLRNSWFTVTAKTTVDGEGATFRGPKAGEVGSDHASIVAEYRAKAKTMSRGEPFVIMGFSANYAAAVHEMYGANFQRPGSGAGFFKSAIAASHSEVLAAIYKNARIK